MHIVGRPIFGGLAQMFIFYVDEAGSNTPHSEPLLNGQTPLFILASLAFKCSSWRLLDRQYLALRKKFFSKEIGTRKAETYEIKGNDLVCPRNAHSRRRHAFMKAALALCKHHSAQGFAVVFRKNCVTPSSKNSMYNMGIQYMVERFGHFLDETAAGLTDGFPAGECHGMMIADSRMKNLDLNVSLSHLSFVFGNQIGQQCQRIVEAPTFTFSQLSVGVQLTDLFASALFAQHYHRHCSTIGNAGNYGHTTFVDEYLKDLQWHSKKAYNGYMMRGYRVLDHRDPP